MVADAEFVICARDAAAACPRRMGMVAVAYLASVASVATVHSTPLPRYDSCPPLSARTYDMMLRQKEKKAQTKEVHAAVLQTQNRTSISKLQYMYVQGWAKEWALGCVNPTS